MAGVRVRSARGDCGRPCSRARVSLLLPVAVATQLAHAPQLPLLTVRVRLRPILCASRPEPSAPLRSSFPPPPPAPALFLPMLSLAPPLSPSPAAAAPIPSFGVDRTPSPSVVRWHAEPETEQGMNSSTLLRTSANCSRLR